MKNFKSFDPAQKVLVKNFVNNLTGLKLALNSKPVEAFYHYILTDGSNTYDCFLKPCYTSGKGRFTSAIKDASIDIIEVLNACSISFEVGNDAPKGGKSGNFIRIINSERARVTNLYNEFINK